MHYLWSALTLLVVIYALDVVSHALAVSVVTGLLATWLVIHIARRMKPPEDRYHDLTY